MSLSIQFHVPLCVFVMMCLVMAVRPKHVAWLIKKGMFLQYSSCVCLALLTDHSILKINIWCTITTKL